MWSFLRGKKRSEDTAPSSSTPAEGASTASEGPEQPAAEPEPRPGTTARPAPGKPATGGVDVVVQRRLDEVGAGIAPEQDEDDLPVQPRDHQPLSREDVVADALDRWAHQITGGSTAPSFLTQMRAGDTVLDLSHSHPSGLAQLLAGRGPTRLSSLVREVGALADARAHARTIREVAERHAEEVGLTTCHLGIGEASWIPAEGAAPVHAPVLVRPITLRLRGNAREDVDLEIDATADLNPVLLRALREAGVAVDARALLATTDSTHGFDPNPVLDAFRSLGEPLPGFRITHALVVGNLMDAAGSVAEDLAAEREDWAGSDLVAALAGDRGAREELRTAAAAPRPELPAEQELVAAVDPDHQAVLAQVLAGQDLAVAAAPGSPTLDLVVDLAEELNARGRSVLVLSQRRRHLAELVEIARGRGVEELVFDLSPDPSLQRNASAALLRSLRRAGSHGLGAQDADPAELGEMREILTGHVEAMHRVQQPWGASAHDAISALAALTRRRPAPRTTVRLRGEVATQMIGEDRLRYAEALQEAAELGVLSTGPEETAWYGAPISSDTQARRAEALIGELRELSLPRLRRAATTTGESLGLQPATSIRRLAERIALLDRVAVVLETFQGAVFSADLPALVAATGDKRWREEHGVTLSWGQRRRLRREAAALQRPAALAPDLHQELAVAAQVREDWRRVAASETASPSVPGTLDTARGAVAQAQKLLDELAVLLDGTPAGADLLGTDIEVLQERFDALHRDRADLATLPRRTELLRRLAFDGLGELVEDLRTRRVPREQVASELDLAWWRSVLELIAGAEPTISQYDGTSLSQVAERFRRLDAASLAAASARVHAAADEARVATMKAYPDTSRAAIGELARSSTVSIRDLAAKYEDILFRARPTWLASPYLVPQVIPRGRHFDVVIVADGGRLPTAAALPSIVRGAQTVVVGDPLEYGGDAAPSLLDDMLRIAPWAELHRDPQPARDGLRAFARRRGLAGETVAVPSPVPAEDDRLVRVEHGTGPVSEATEYVESTEAELRRVTDLVIEHARSRPERSLAVLTVTAEHARRVMERVMNTVSVIPALRGFFDPAAGEYFTVVPAAHAAGIVRDDVIVSLGFGKTPHGRLLHRFGPLSEDGGRKALATLVTRARGRTLVVSAIDVEDLDPSRLRSDGARDLRALLWVLRGGRDVAVLSHVAALTGAAGESPAPAEEPARETRPPRTGAVPAVVPAPPAEAAPVSPEREEQDLDAAIEAALARKTAEARQAEEEHDDAGSVDAVRDDVVQDDAVQGEGVETEDQDAPTEPGTGEDSSAEDTADAAAEPRDPGSPEQPAETASVETPAVADSDVPEDPDGTADPSEDTSTEDPAAPTTPAHQPRELETDALVRDLADRLWRLGLVVERDFGLTEDRIELALGHPDLPGRLLLAVDTDGSRYVATPSQRERDRLRAERLEAAGWATERVWSWALFIDPDGEAARIRRSLDRALRLVQAEESGSSPQGVATIRHRLPRPQVPAGHPLSFYSSEDFDAVVEYVCSDGRARLEEHLATEVRAFLGFEQRSVLLDVSVSSAIRRFQERQ
ncbi:hypothetical protein [Brachybacterium squillarum]|uniref:hypothetical protein n=1 Tax=Brachybacterium squillarum TaxID=661979 RepID=UPI000262B1EE|nr:hypothetical protein [Brachybacterium squillarum]